MAEVVEGLMAEVDIDILDLHSFSLLVGARLALVEAAAVVVLVDLEAEALEAADLEEAGKSIN